MGTRGPFPGSKARPGREADHSPHLVPRSRMTRSYTSSTLNHFNWVQTLVPHLFNIYGNIIILSSKSRNVWNVGKFLGDYSTQHPRRHLQIFLLPGNRSPVIQPTASHFFDWTIPVLGMAKPNNSDTPKITVQWLTHRDILGLQTLYLILTDILGALYLSLDINVGICCNTGHDYFFHFQIHHSCSLCYLTLRNMCTDRSYINNPERKKPPWLANVVEMHVILSYPKNIFWFDRHHDWFSTVLNIWR
jgi:hypothetical protein